MDLNKLESASREIASIQGTKNTLPNHLRRIMQIIRGIVACDSINLGTIDLKSEEGFHLDLDGFLMPQERRRNLPHFKHQHPMLNYSRQKGLNPPLRFSDFFSRRQFEETGLYRECYRGYTHSMLTFGIDSPPGLNISFVLSRQGGEFSDDEVSQLSILQPLISVVYHRLLLQEAMDNNRQHDHPVGLMVGSGHNLITLDNKARELITRYFPNQSLHRVPQPMLEKIQRPNSQIQIIYDKPNSNRISGFVEHAGKEWLLKLWEESGPLSTSQLSKLGLTGRQAEVLQWVAGGKTNAEIAIILCISNRTVEKHLEHIYQKIGVETRLSAIHYCRNLQREATIS